MRRLFPALLLLASCAFEPQNAEPISPGITYRALWDSAQACTGLHGDFDQLRFYVAPDEELPYRAGSTFGKDIYLRERYKDHPMVVKHEMIHALGIKGHPLVPFADPCNAVWESYEG